MSVIKLMSRIVAPSYLLEDSENTGNKNAAIKLHDHTYGITSDPLTQFACAFSALIHDVDHVGVSNAQLVKEGVPIAQKYGECPLSDLLDGSSFLERGLTLDPANVALHRRTFSRRTKLIGSFLGSVDESPVLYAPSVSVPFPFRSYSLSTVGCQCEFRYEFLYSICGFVAI